MRINTTANERDISHALPSGCRFSRLNRTRRGFEVILSGSSPRRSASREGDQAATWDEWGFFFASLYVKDASAKCGPYLNSEHFHWSTGDRYNTTGTNYVPVPCDHKWRYSGSNVTGSYHIQGCVKDCGAIRRYLGEGYSWSQISG